MSHIMNRVSQRGAARLRNTTTISPDALHKDSSLPHAGERLGEREDDGPRFVAKIPLSPLFREGERLHSPHERAELKWSEARISAILDNDRYRLDDGRLAHRALSCLIVPHAGDRILVASPADGDCHIVHILSRTSTAPATLAVPHTTHLSIQHEEVSLNATRRIAINSLGDAEMTAATGTLSLQGRNLFATAIDSFVQHAEHWMSRAGHTLLEARALFRAHGQHTILTAEKDVKIDGERINMG